MALSLGPFLILWCLFLYKLFLATIKPDQPFPTRRWKLGVLYLTRAVCSLPVLFLLDVAGYDGMSETTNGRCFDSIRSEQVQGGK